MKVSQMRAINYLERYGEVKHDLVYLAARVKAARTTLESIKSTLGNLEEPITTVPGGREKLIASLADLSGRYDKKVQEVEALRIGIESTIWRHLKGIQKTVILHHYLNEMSFLKIAEITNYSETHVRRIHLLALEKLGKSWPKTAQKPRL